MTESSSEPAAFASSLTRFYVPLHLKPRNYRRYDAEDVARLKFVRRARDLGFTIDQVRALLDLSDQRDLDCGTVMEMTRQHLAEIEQKIADLTVLKQHLFGMLTSCHGGTVAECSIIDALTPPASS
ncbi:MAG: MerR family DNA-binding protein [Burkholderiaceae bacterium]|nr:MerR family DNA-binding protein [Burkholderiaceae bacterium]